MRTRARRWLPLALFGLGVVCALTWILMPPVRRGPSLAQLEAVAPGMTHEQVVALIGYPSGDYRTDPQRFSVSHHSILQQPLWLRTPYWELRNEVWTFDSGMLYVFFDADGRVVWRVVNNAKDTRPPWLTRQIRRFVP